MRATNFLKIFKSQITHDLKFTGINQLVRVFSGPVLLVALPFFLSSEDLGFWFAMTGFAAMIAFADLGFSSISLQFASHEFAKLQFDEYGEIVGEKESIERLSSLFIFSFKWICTIAGISLLVVTASGCYLLQKHTTTIQWESPWILLCIASAISIILNTVMSFFEGCNSVAKIQKIRFIMAASNSLGLILFLFSGLKLASLGLSLTISAIIGTRLMYCSFSMTIRNLVNTSAFVEHSWKGEIYPLLARYSISWLSGYAMFQLLSPIMFYYGGAILAGKVGLSISLFTAIFSISNIWTTSQIPLFGIAIANRNFAELFRIFKHGLSLSIITYLLASIFLAVVYFEGRSHFTVFAKFLNYPSLLLLGFAWFLQLIVHNYAIFLRSFKQDPLALVSAIAAVHTIILTILLMKYFGPDYLLIGFVTSYFWLLPWVLILYKIKKESL